MLQKQKSLENLVDEIKKENEEKQATEEDLNRENETIREKQKQIDELKRRLDDMERAGVIDHDHEGIETSKIWYGNLKGIYFTQATINPGNLVDGAGETVQATSVPGATPGDFVLVAAPYDLQDVTVTAYVQANGVVEIRLQNESGGARDLASGTWRILIITLS